MTRRGAGGGPAPPLKRGADVTKLIHPLHDVVDEGVEVQGVVIDDDVAVQDSLYTAGRRGVGATVLAEKIAGARAEEGGSLAEVAALVKKVNESSRSMGMALTSCIVPANGKPTFE